MMSDILLIDSDAKRRQAMSAALQKEGLRVDNATDLDDVSGNCDCVVIVNTRLDENWPAKAQTIPFVVLADGGSIPEAVQCIRKGANDYLALPIEANELVAAIERACTQNHPQSDRQSSQIQLIGDSPQMQGIKEAIVKAGPTSSPILIQGSSGTGKELVARALHACSGRSSAPLISLNCATVPHNFIESELFGVEIFDGEQKEHPGLIAAAHGGTLFLDEIAELPDSAQARLLRVLDGENRRVGSSETHAVDVRVISATHRNLEQLVAEGAFREDLFYRINVVNFTLPLLKERQDDAISIATWLLERTAARLGKTGLHFAEEALAAIRSYHWPGNVRELENAIERAVILSDPDSAISRSLLAIEVSASMTTQLDAAAAGDLTSLEDYFVSFVQQNQEHLTETELAEKLGISRKSLWERRQRLNIPRRKTKKRGPRQDSASKP